MASKPSIEVPHSNECEAVAKVLKSAGFLSEAKAFKPSGKKFKKLSLELAFEDGLPKVTDAKRVSKPGRRVYKPYSELHRIAAGYGVSVLSTSRGIMSGDEARKKKLGGEVICEVQ